MGSRITDWRPDDPAFWQSTGRRIATRNLWISIPALLLAFAVWMVWSVVVVKLRAIGFAFSEAQEFWLTALSAANGHLFLYVPERIRAGGRVETMQFTMGSGLFTFLIFVVGCGMGIGKAAVYKYIPEYFPTDVGAVGGLVGLLGALGGFFLPPLFAYALETTGIPQTTFVILLLLTLASFVWLHWVVHRLLHRATPHLENQFDDHR